MPIYEYVCKKCSQPFELLVRGNEKPVCPHCGSKSLAKQLSVPSACNQANSSLREGTSRPVPT